MTALGDAILQARQATPSLFSNVSSNYLLGLVQNKTLSPTDFGQIANTNTVVLSSNNQQGGRSSLGIGQSIISAVQNGLSLNLKTLSAVPGSPTGATTPPVSSTPGVQTTTTPSTLSNITDKLTSTTGISITSLAVGGIILFLVLRRS